MGLNDTIQYGADKLLISTTYSAYQLKLENKMHKLPPLLIKDGVDTM